MSFNSRPAGYFRISRRCVGWRSPFTSACIVDPSALETSYWEHRADL